VGGLLGQSLAAGKVFLTVMVWSLPVLVVVADARGDNEPRTPPRRLVLYAFVMMAATFWLWLHS
jgi:hypothetical protein